MLMNIHWKYVTFTVIELVNRSEQISAWMAFQYLMERMSMSKKKI